MADFKDIQKGKELTFQIQKPQVQGQEQNAAPPVQNALIRQENKIGFEKRPVVGKKEIVVLPVQISKKNLTAEEYRALQQHYDAETYEEYKEELKKAGIQLPDEPELESMVQIRNDLKYGVFHEENGKIKKVEYFWKKGISEDTQKMIDWTVNYTIVHDKMIAELKEEVLEEALPIRTNYNISLKDPEKIYEYQGRGTNNCFCCAGVSMINQYLKTKGKEGNFTQNDMRKYRSVIKKFDPSFERYKQEYEDNIRVIDSYAGEGKEVVGNVFQMGDFFFENLPGRKVALNKMNLTVPPLVSKNEKKDERIAHNVKATFMDTVYKVLSTGNVLSFLQTNGQYGHYLTITGIKGDTIEYLDSMIENQAHRKQTMKVEAMLHRLAGKGMTYELAWLSDMDDPEELTAEYSNLNYDEQEGFSLKHLIPDNVLNPMHTRGLEVRKEPGDHNMPPEGVALVTYIPNPLKKIETESFEKHFGIEEEEPQQEIKIEQPKQEIKKEEPKKAEIKKEEKPKQEIKKEIKKAEIKKEESKKEEIKKEEPKKEEKKQEAPKQEIKQEEKKEEIKEEPKKEEIKKEEQKQEQPKKEEIKKEESAERELQRRLEATRLRRERGEQMRREAREIKFVTNAERRKQLKTKDEVLAREKKSKNYEAFGVGFSLGKTEVNAADSEVMQDVKLALKDYLEIRNRFSERSGATLKEDEKQSLAQAYDVLQSAIKEYRRKNGRFFKFGRGAARMKQVRQIEEKIQADNQRFSLSTVKREPLQVTRLRSDQESRTRTIHVGGVRSWERLDRAWQIFRGCLKATCVVPLAVMESLCRGIPAIFGHHFRSGVYKRTGKWWKEVLEELKKSGKNVDLKDLDLKDVDDRFDAGPLVRSLSGLSDI